jgi:hypothetical protein
MSAIEYGSYYWCVILERAGNTEPESIHLHADEMEIDQKGTLLFRSAGRRTAGADPQQNGDKKNDEKNNTSDKSATSEQGHKESHGKSQSSKLMTYVAFAPGTWIAVYAAKLKDGSAAAVEHWNVPNGKPGLLATVPPNASAEGYLPE